MQGFTLSNRAKEDLIEIAFYTIQEFGESQSIRYKNQLEECLNTLAKNPLIGRDSSELAKGLRRFPFKAHTIFYTPREKDILVVRVLGKSMDFQRHL